MNQQDEYGSSQQFGIESIEVQKVDDERLMPEASKETDRSYLFKTNRLLVNVDIVPNERVVAIKAIQDYSCNQEGVLDYFLLQEVEYLAHLETKEFDKEVLLRRIDERKCWRSRWNLIDKVDDELSNRVDTPKDQRQNRVWNP